MKKAQIKGSSSRFVLSAASAVFGMSLVSLFTTVNVKATEIEIKPIISSTYTYITDADFSGFQFDTPIEEGHQALTLTPGVSMLAKGPVWNGNWNVTHTSIHQIENDFEDTSFNNISLNNQFGLIKNRVVFTLNASRKNQNIDQRFAGVSDPIFNQSEYIDVDSGTLGLFLSNKRGSDWRNSLSYNITTTDFDEKELEQTNATSTNLIKGDTQNAALRLGYGQRVNQVKGELVINASANERNTRGKQDNIAASINVGIPIWSSFDLVLTGTKSKNTIANLNFADSEFDNESYGAGLAWRISQRSFIEATYNKDSRGQTRFSSENDDFDDTFISYRVVLQPSKNSNLSYENSRRFYGESNSFSMSHTASRWNVEVSYSEDLVSTSRLVGEATSAGFFGCSLAAISRDDCNYVGDVAPEPVADIFFFEFFDTSYSFVEELSLNKGLNASLSYEARKSTVSLSYNKGKREFLEREDDAQGNEQETERWSLNYNHRMSRRTSLVASASKTEVISNGNNADRKGFQASIGLERRLTRKATGKLNIRRYDNDGNSNNQNRKDTRLELQYTYQF